MRHLSHIIAPLAYHPRFIYNTQMNVYDFDGTIYAGDSTVDFTLYCLRHQPHMLRALPEWGRALALAFNQWRINPRDWDKTECKECFFSYLPMLHDLEGTLQNFWKTYEHRLYGWYLSQKRYDDVIISASSTFLLQPICDKLGVMLIASEVDPTTGRFISDNCHGPIKALRFKERCSDSIIDEFYSDSMSDLPMARLARHAYLVRNGIIRVWNTT